MLAALTYMSQASSILEEPLYERTRLVKQDFSIDGWYWQINCNHTSESAARYEDILGMQNNWDASAGHFDNTFRKLSETV